jgi:hypothetical protein
MLRKIQPQNMNSEKSRTMRLLRQVIAKLGLPPRAVAVAELPQLA